MYQINIDPKVHGQPIEIDTIRTELDLAGLLASDMNVPDSEPSQHHVWVHFGCVIDAVRIINNLGYTTDEDE